MKKHWLTLIMLIILIVVVFTALNRNTRTTYVALGDSLAVGVTPEETVDLSYTDMFAEYLYDEDVIEEFNKDFAVRGYTTSDLLSDIENNIEVNDNSIIDELKKAGIITISIGANDIIFNLDTIKDSNYDEEVVDQIIGSAVTNVRTIIEIIRSYNNKAEIYLIGYYLPVTGNVQLNTKLIPKYTEADQSMEDLCREDQCVYVRLSEIFKENTQYLPNKNDIHPSLEGYNAISEQLIQVRKYLLKD